MVLLLAPYNTAMRLGQGFNSYTQEIMIDDAVVFADDAVENEIQNDGTTMRQLSMAMAKDDVWMLSDEPAAESSDNTGQGNTGGGNENTNASGAADGSAVKPDTVTTARMASKPLELDQADQESASGSGDELTLVTHPHTSSMRAASTPAVTKPVVPKAGTKKPTPSKNSAKDAELIKARDADPKSYEQPGDDKLSEGQRKTAIDERKAERLKQREAAARRAAQAEPWTDADIKKKYGWELQDTPEDKNNIKGNPTWTYRRTGRRGPSQIVTYTSKFVDKLSDVADDMNISGAFSVKYGMFGGSAKGNFIDVKKFKDSDMNFYLSVKVVNTTVNWKDKLQFQPLTTDPHHGADTFNKIFGDSFISGFIEGGELNAVVSMKVMDKINRNAIAAEAKVALTAGPVNVDAQAKVDIAKSNIQKSTESTVQISWSGGGFLKPMQQSWDIESLTQVAARFPDLIAQAPQRTYAILTKYENLRSYQELRITPSSPLQYELAKVYTAHLMDTFMDYKTMYTDIVTSMEEISNKTRKFVVTMAENPPVAVDYMNSDPTTRATSNPTTVQPKTQDPLSYDYSFIQDTKFFPANMKGLEWGRKVCRFQMMAIINEIEGLKNDPKLATDPGRKEVFQGSYMFRARLPETVPSEVEPDVFLSGDAGEKNPIVSLYEIDRSPIPEDWALGLRLSRATPEEQAKITAIQNKYPSAGRHHKVTDLCGEPGYGDYFNALDFIKNDFVLRSVRCWASLGAIRGFEVGYENGLMLRVGTVPADGKGALECLKTLADEDTPHMNALSMTERITGVFVFVEEPVRVIVPTPASSDDKNATRANVEITRLTFSSSTGTNYIFRDTAYSASSFKNGVKLSFEAPSAGSALVGFWGRANRANKNGNKALEGLARLGFIWALHPKPRGLKGKAAGQEADQGSATV